MKAEPESVADTEVPKKEPTRAQIVVVSLVAIAVVLPVFVPMLLPVWHQFSPTKVERAKADLEFLEKNGASKPEVCAAKRVLQDAYAEARDADGYQMAKLDADICYTGLDLERMEQR
jgi:hypothetical protein